MKRFKKIPDDPSSQVQKLGSLADKLRDVGVLKLLSSTITKLGANQHLQLTIRIILLTRKSVGAYINKKHFSND